MNVHALVAWAPALALAVTGCTTRAWSPAEGGGGGAGAGVVDGATDQAVVDGAGDQSDEGRAPFVVEGTELANGQWGPTDIAVDDAFVYWGTFEDDRVTKIAKDGASAPIIVDRTLIERKSMAADGTAVYWGGMRLHAQEKATGLIQEFNVGEFAGILRTAGGRLFWLNETGGTDGLGSMLPDGTDMRYVAAASQPTATTIVTYGTDGSTLFLGYNDPTDDAAFVEMLPATGGTPVPFATTRFLVDILVDDEYVYWLEGRQTDGEIQKKLKTGAGDVITVLTVADILLPQSMAMDATSLYWTELGFGAGGGAVRKVSKAGGQAVLLAKNQVVPQGLAVDDGFVYWVNYGPTRNGTVRRIAK